MSKSEKPKRSVRATQPTDAHAVAPIVAKVAAELTGVPYLGGLAGALADLIKARFEQTREKMQREAEQRLAGFYARMLHDDATMDDAVAKAMVDDQDLHALIRACVADIEAEKVAEYAQLARSIASGSLPKAWRRHFILSLRDLSAEDLLRLRGAFVAQNNSIVPAAGPSMGPSHFLDPGGPGTSQAISVANLERCGFAHDGRLSIAGEQFAKACLPPARLTPASLGFKTWTGHHCAILNYQMGTSPLLDSLTEKLQDALRAVGIKSSVVAVIRHNEQEARSVFSLGVLVVDQLTDGLRSNLSHLASLGQKVPILLVDAAGQAGDLDGIPEFGRVHGAGRGVAAIANEALLLCVKKLGMPIAGL